MSSSIPASDPQVPDEGAQRRIVAYARTVVTLEGRGVSATAARIATMLGGSRRSKEPSDRELHKVLGLLAQDVELRGRIAALSSQEELGPIAWRWLHANEPPVPGEDRRLASAARARERAESERDEMRVRLDHAGALVENLEARVRDLDRRLDEARARLEVAGEDLVRTREERDAAKAELTRQQRSWETQRDQMRARLAQRDALVAELLTQRDRLDRRWSELVARGRDASTPRRSRGVAPTTRRPRGVPGGLLADSVEAVRFLLATSEVTLFVDGCNAALGRRATGTLEERREDLLGALDAHQARYGSRTVVVFDGDGELGGGGRRSGTRIVYTAADVIADDVICDEIAALPDEDPVVVVTDDQELRGRLRRLGVDLVGVDALWTWLRS